MIRLHVTSSLSAPAGCSKLAGSSYLQPCSLKQYLSVQDASWLHVTAVACLAQIQAVQAVTSEHNGQQYKFAREEEERTKLWSARHTAYSATMLPEPQC